MNLENIRLSERSQTQKTTCYDSTFMERSEWENIEKQEVD